MSNTKIHTDTLNLAEVAIRLGAIYEREALLDTMLIDAMNMSNADGGSLYLVKNDELHFLLVKNRSLNLDLGRESALPKSFQPIPISEEKAKNLCVFAVQKCRSVNIPDVYQNTVFDLDGTKRADAANNYRSVSMLTVPIMGANYKAIGVLQLINAKDDSGTTIAFHHHVQTVIEAIANMAAVSYSNTQLHMQNAQLFDSFLSLISAANHSKNPNESIKTKRIMLVLELLSEAISASQRPPFHRTRIDSADYYEQRLLVWMLGLQSLMGSAQFQKEQFLASLPLSQSLTKTLLLVGAPPSIDHPLSLRLLHFALGVHEYCTETASAKDVYSALEKYCTQGTLDHDLLAIAQASGLMETFIQKMSTAS